MSFNKQTYLALDLETTGLDWTKDEIIEIALVRFDEEGEIERWSSLVNYQQKLPDVVSELTSIDEKDLKNAPMWSEISEKINELLEGNVVLVGHNLNFDLSFLAKKGIVTTKYKKMDTWYMATMLMPEMGSYSLEALARFTDWEYDAHRALNDTLAVVALWRYLKSRINYLSNETLLRIKGVLQKGRWDYGSLFENVNLVSHTMRENGCAKCEINNKDREVKDSVVDANVVLVESNWQTILDEIQTKKSALWVVSNDMMRFLRKKTKKVDFLDRQENYLCRERAKKYWIKKKLTNAEIGLMIKILIRIDGGYWDGFLGDVSFDRFEQEVLSNLRCGKSEVNHKNCFWYTKMKNIEDGGVAVVVAKVLEKMKNIHDAVYIWDNEVLLEDGLDKIFKLKFDDSEWFSLIGEIRECHDCNRIGSGSGKKWEDLEKDSKMLWGTLGLLIKSKGADDYFGRRLNFSPALYDDLSYQVSKNIASKLYKNYQDLLLMGGICDNHRDLVDDVFSWMRVLAGEERKIVYLLIDDLGKISSTMIDMDYGQIVENISNKANKLIISSRSLFLKNGYYGDRLLTNNVVKVVSKIEDKKRIDVLSTDCFGDGRADHGIFDFKKVNLLLFASKKNLDEYLQSIKNNIVKDSVTNYSGVDRRRVELGKKCYGLLLSRMYDLKNLVLYVNKFDTVYLDKLPFDIPNDLVINYRSLIFGEENFDKYYWMRMVSKIKFVLSFINQNGCLYIGDKRFANENYANRIKELL